MRNRALTESLGHPGLVSSRQRNFRPDRGSGKMSLDVAPDAVELEKV